MKANYFVVFMFAVAFALLSIVSCSDNVLDEGVTNQTIDQENVDLSAKDASFTLKREFATALAKILGSNQEVRELVKNEALKKINHDYDVLYMLIKDKRLSDGETLEKLLLKHINAATLKSIEQEMPTLTIFVPSLPENTFSAEIWDTGHDLPSVAISVRNYNDVPVYESSGESFTLKGDEIPAFPIVVIKENERIIANNNAIDPSLQLRSSSNESTQFSFTDKIFDNTGSLDNTLRSAPYDTIVFYDNIRGGGISTIKYPVPENRRKILDAYDVFKNIAGWQRDYIYYNLTPTNTEGSFNYEYKEHIVGFQLMGDAMGALNKISDQYDNDPKRTDVMTEGHGAFWTDGEFEFKIKTYLGNKNGLSPELATYLRAKPDDLFEFTFVNVGGGGRGFPVLKIKATNTKHFKLPPIPLFEWNLESYIGSVKIAVEEVDETQTVRSTIATSAEFATNFKYSTTLGKKVKHGLEFGASAKETRNISYEVTTTQGNDELGEVIVNVWDNIITDRTITPYTEMTTPDRRPGATNPSIKYTGLLSYNQKYYTGWYRIEIAPLRTY